MTPTEFRDRLEAVARRTGLTASDLAVWFGRPRPTVRTWLHGTRPQSQIGGQVWDELAQRLIWLERADRFPIPPSYCRRASSSVCSNVSDYDQFDSLAPASKATLAFEGEPHAKLKRNLNLALDKHEELMSMVPESVGDRRIILDAATATVKAALTTDRTALKARSEKTIERVLLRLVFLRKIGGYAVGAEDEKMLKTAPRAELEAALGPRIADFDRMNENAG